MKPPVPGEITPVNAHSDMCCSAVEIGDVSVDWNRIADSMPESSDRNNLAHD